MSDERPTDERPAPALPPSPAAPAPYEPLPPGTSIDAQGEALWIRPWTDPPPPTGYPQQPQPSPPPAYPPPPVYQQQQWPPAVPLPPENGKATASLVLGIVGAALLVTSFGALFFLNLPCSVLAWVLAVQARRRIERGETPKGEGTAQAGLVLGALGTILGGLAVLGWIALIAAS